MKKIKIGKFELKNYGRPFIAAEVGINHNGNIKNAIKMIDVAKKSGCDAIKFQTFKAKELVSDKSINFSYFSKGKKVTESMYKMFKRYEIQDRFWKKIKNYCKKKKIIFFSTPQNLSDLKKLIELKVPAIKIGSDDFTNIPLIENYLNFKIPVILSTGMSNINYFKKVLKIKNFSNKKVIFLLCTSEYPTKHKFVNINKLHSIKKIIKKNLVGFSDHTVDNTASIMAVANGCCFFEKHFTLNHNLSGPDHWFSLNPKQLKDWVKSIRNAYECMGSKDIKPTQAEKKNKLSFQRKIVASRNITKGEIIKLSDVQMLRVSNKSALNPYDIKKIIGKRSSKNFDKYEPIFFKK